MTLERNAVGEKVYVFTKAKGQPSPGTKRCVITSHGGQSIINSTFDVPGSIDLVFYGPHGDSLQDPGLESVITGAVKSLEKISAKSCQDYALSKYQGSHSSSGETYQSIEALDGRLSGLKTSTAEGIAQALQMMSRASEDDASFKQLLALVDSGLVTLERCQNWMDIVTIRNRKLKACPMLSQVIKDLHGAGYAYTEIHCCFCRSPQLPFKSSGTYTAPKA